MKTHNKSLLLTKTKYSNKNEYREDIKHLNKDLNHKIFFFIMIYFGKKWGRFGKKYGRNDFFSTKLPIALILMF
jgi:hypothetical protein